MAGNDGLGSLCYDVYKSLCLVAKLSWYRSLVAWLCVPFGSFLILLACFGVDSLISMSSVSFPASVACMIILFFALIACNIVIGDRRTRSIVSVIDVPLPFTIITPAHSKKAGFSLRYINIFFTPSFVLLPLSSPISGVEVGKIIAVFVLGFIAAFIITAYMVRGIQLVLGTSKRAITERAEEMGNEDDSMPLAEVTGAASQASTSATPAESLNDLTTASTLEAPSRTQDPSEIRTTEPFADPSTESRVATSQTIFRQTAPLLTRPEVWAANIRLNLDRITWTMLFLFVGIPIYYSTGYAMPAQITSNILAYLAAVSLPTSWKRILHPVLVSSAITVLGNYILGAIRGQSLDSTLADYSTGTTYLKLWHGESNLPAPGAADILKSVLDVSIVAFALPMFQYRKELQRHFSAIVIPNVAISIASLFGYPAICYAIGISPKRSLSFAARSLTLALATPSVSNLGGDANTVAALAIMSGILGSLIGQKILNWLRIPEDDYVTRGVALGSNSSAIATATLLVSDPRAASLSILSMSLFGTITVALTSVPPIVHAIQGLVGL